MSEHNDQGIKNYRMGNKRRRCSTCERSSFVYSKFAPTILICQRNGIRVNKKKICDNFLLEEDWGACE